MITNKEKLRVGILLDSHYISAWAYKMLEEIKANSCCEIALIVKIKAEKIEKKNILTRIIKNHDKILFELYKKIDRRLFKCTPDAFEIKDIRTILSIDTIEVVQLKTNSEDHVNEFDLAKIRKYNIDIFIKMGSGFLNGEILKTAKYGIWSLIHGDNKVIKGGPSGIWEIMNNWNETAVTLQIISKNPDEAIIIDKSYSSTHRYSLNKNKNNYYWKAVSIIPLKILELYSLGDELYFKRTDELNRHPQFYSNRQFISPTNMEMISFGIRLILNATKNKIDKIFFFNQWILLFKLSPFNSISTSFSQYTKIIPPKDREWADPHIIKRNNKYYIFIEELLYKENKGHISLIIMDDKGCWTEPVKVLERDYHLSYPFLIEDNGDLFLIPESENNNTIELYKCVDFPLKWELENVLINDIIVADSTVILQNGIYWLFTNVIENKGESNHDKLFLFSSEILNSGNWISHPQNPIITDVRSSRPAGKLFTFNNKLYRPSQNCAKHYGYGIIINEVIELTKTSYKEQVVDSIYPDWDKKLMSTHTINSVDKLTVIDAQMKRRKHFN